MNPVFQSNVVSKELCPVPLYRLLQGRKGELGDVVSPQKPERLRVVWGPPEPLLTFPTAVELLLVGRLRVLQEQADGMGQLGSGSSETPQKQPLHVSLELAHTWGN